MNVRDLRYDPEVLSAFGITGIKDKLPPIRKSGEICGTVSRSAAAETGLREGTPVAGGLFDISACAIGTGITTPDRLCLVAGSWSINEYISPAPVQDRDLFMTSAYCIPGYWLITEASATSASNLEWVVSERACRARAPGKGRSCSKRNEMVDGIAPEDSDVVFPFLWQQRRPGATAGLGCAAGTEGYMLRRVRGLPQDP
jgi:L-xylulokinase